jgi:hypothetical protein
MKVYGWQGWRGECPAAPNGSHQTREICAAKSAAAVARVVGVKSPARLFNFCETGNAREIEIATAEPGVVFWSPLDSRRSGEWTADREAGAL